MSEGKSYVRLVFDLPVKREFHYFLPDRFRGAVSIGQRVVAPFGQMNLPGFIVGFTHSPDIPLSKIKEISYCLDDEPLVDRCMLRLTRWLSEYYFCSWGKALFEAVPAAVIKKGKIKKQKEVLFPKAVKFSSVSFIPTRKQKKVLCLIKDKLVKRQFGVMLFFGIRGSGKTETCFHAVDYCLEKGRQAIILVPEIARLDKVIERLFSKYGSQIGVLHSQLSRNRHYEEWQRIKKGEVNIIVGTRSAVFAPCRHLGLIIVLDEHDSSYKQSNDPKYQAKIVAIERAKISKALVILHSETPSIETFYEAKTGKFKMVTFSERIDKKSLFEVKIVDMAKERSKHRWFISNRLEEAIKERIEKKEQVILFLNRRGFATSLLCRQCGFVLRCSTCNIPFTFHQTEKIARCHYCGHTKGVPKVCPRCFSSYIRYSGLGTEKLEERIRKFYAQSRIIRMDSDSAGKKAVRKKFFKMFEEGKADFLIGTQILINDWRFSNLSLIGIISADSILNLADFRAGEKTFQLLSRLSSQPKKNGRKAEVFIQTFNPEHPVIQALKKHDFEIFYKEEIKFRRELGYPPFSHFVNVIVRGDNEGIVEKKSRCLYLRLNEIKGCQPIEILGPAVSPYSQIKGKYRRYITLKAVKIRFIRNLLDKALKGFSRTKKLNISVDVDSLNVF